LSPYGTIISITVGIPANIQLAIMANHEPNDKGVYPDWADKEYVLKYPEVKIANLFETQRCHSLVSKRTSHEILDNEQRRTARCEREAGGKFQ
jgi:hypothetical protein